MTNDSSILQVLTGYYRAFSTLDPQAVQTYFTEPAMLISAQGVYAAQTHANLLNLTLLIFLINTGMR